MSPVSGSLNEINAAVTHGIHLLGSGQFESAYSTFSAVIAASTKFYGPAPWSDDSIDSFFMIGDNLTRRGYASLGKGSYSDSLQDFSLGAALGSDPVSPLCAISSIRATCKAKVIYDPQLSSVIAKAAIWYASQTPSHLPIAQLTHSLSLIALGEWKAAIDQLEQISAIDRRLLVDFDAYLAAARGKFRIRRSVDDYAQRTQEIFLKEASELKIIGQDEESTSECD